MESRRAPEPAAAPRAARNRVPTCYIHVGTHKTGSTAIQQFLFAYADRLAQHGILVPVSGRLADTTAGCGHHCIAWDALGAAPAAPVDGSLEALIEEIRIAALPAVCISSEEFAHLYTVPNNMQRLKEGLRGIGYRAIVVVYLRPQADYLEALYAEVAQHAAVRDFWDCYRELLVHGAAKLWHASRFPAPFDYERKLLRPFRHIFGARNVVVRPFRRFGRDAGLIGDFLRIVGAPPGLAIEARAVPAVNARRGFAAVAASIRTNVAGARPAAAAAPPGGPFELLRPHEIARLAWRFAGSNLLLFARHGVWVGTVSRTRLVRSFAHYARTVERVRFLRSLTADTAQPD